MGVIITAIAKGSPAEKMGLAIGDIVLYLKNAVFDEDDFLRDCGEIAPGDSIRVTIGRQYGHPQGLWNLRGRLGDKCILEALPVSK